MHTKENDICEINKVCKDLFGTEKSQEIEYIRPIFRYFDSNNYKIVSNKCYKIVQSEVSNLINSGWDLHKGVVVTCCNYDVIYTQVLVKTAIIH